MPRSLKPLPEQTIVITGASSGIGLATARAAAKEGARVVLAARNAEALAGVEAQINAAGGQAIHVVADVGRREEVEKVAQAAVDRFGGFHTWVNDAGVSIWGRLWEVSDEDHRRLFDTNFWGVVYGSLVAAAHLKEKGGAIINLGSVASDVAFPLQGMYSASKHAIKGFTDALRTELEAEGAPISVTLIKPASIDTPLPDNARAYTDRAPKLPPPVYAPEEVARAILHAATHPQRDIYVGGAARMMSGFNKHFPRAMDRVSEKMLINQELGADPPRNREGALYRPGGNGQVHGNQPGMVMPVSLYTRATMHPGITGAMLGAAGLATVTWLRGGLARYRRND